MDEGIVMIYTTCAELDEAKVMANALVGGGLAACANVQPPHLGVFRWEGKVSEVSEVGVLFKSSEAVYERAVAKLRDIHPYTQPVVCWWGADALPETIAWVKGA